MNNRIETVATALRSAWPPVLTGGVYLVAALAALLLTRGGDGIATVWPASGILFAALLTVPAKRAGWHIAAAFAASMMANIFTGTAPLAAMVFSIANMAESSSAAWLLRTRAKCRVTFVEPGGLRCFGLAALIGTVISATVALTASPQPSFHFWFSWFATDLLGIFIVTPLLLITHRVVTRLRSTPNRKAVREGTTILTLVAMVTGLVFAQSSYPLLFLPMLAVQFAVFRLGPFGATGGVLIVGCIGSVATSLGFGPVMLIQANALERSLMLQLYFLCVFMAALPMAALLAARGRLLANFGEKVRLLELAEQAGQIGHWRLDTASQTITWSKVVFLIHGLEGDQPPLLNKAIDAYHPEDRERVAAHIQHSLDQHQGFQFRARIVRPDGEIRHVMSRGEIDSAGSGGPIGLFGIIQDISEQVAHEEMTERAPIAAEEAAQQAIVMAETDQLTGIANRRRASFVLDQIIVAAQQSPASASIAIFDIDHFKRINDTYGHQCGDEVLKRVAADAARCLRSGDTIGRLGGEEFVIILPGATAETALQVAERVRTAVERGGRNSAVTISIGVAELASGETADAVLRRADCALYVAKREGRNTLRLAA